jgi:hypothetical protein
MTSDNIQFLLKFGSLENMTRLLKEGLVYARPIRHFKQNIEHKRYDQQEGLQEFHHLKNQRLYLKENEDDGWKYITVTTGKFNTFLDDTKLHNYSMYAITEKKTRENQFHRLPDEMKAFGDWYVLVHNPRIFIQRLEAALKEGNLVSEGRLVRYYDSTTNQKSLDFFCKSSEYASQQEFRILIQNNSSSPTELLLGDLEDIAEIHHIGEFEGFRFIWE